MKIIELEDHHIPYLGNLLAEKWARLDKARSAEEHTSEEYRRILAEQHRVENIAEFLKNAKEKAE